MFKKGLKKDATRNLGDKSIGFFGFLNPTLSLLIINYESLKSIEL